MAAVPEQILGQPIANSKDEDPGETQEWLQALDGVIRTEGAERAAFLIDQQISHARVSGVNQAFHAETPISIRFQLNYKCAYQVIKILSIGFAHLPAGMQWRWSCGRIKIRM